MSKIYFLFGLHNHQPVGNFEHVFSEAYDLCYHPLLEVLKRFPHIRVSIHHSGPLLEWLEKNKPEYMDSFGEMVGEGRVDILGGGFYEPILSVLPERDAVGQLEMMNRWAEKRFGVRPRGAWLAERIWDPSLPRILSEAGMEFTLLDDTHFYYAGLKEKDMHGYWVTERHGSTTAIFPIDMTLRYSIPFKQPEETLEYWKRLKEMHGTTGITYGDDGEKFGMWPETNEWVYGKKWLARFLDMVEKNPDVVETITFSEYLDRFPSNGRIYLPMASYEEMMHWSLPPDTARDFSNILKQLKAEDRFGHYRPFLRGGMWDNFLVKYGEGNRLHKRMLYASERIEKAQAKSRGKKAKENMARELYRGQCNCSYWHGLFGGLYLGNLRHAVFSHLINAGKEADSILHSSGDWVEVNEQDFFRNMGKSTVVETKDVFLLLDPGYGGTVAEIDYKPASFNLSNVLTRRPEEYHQKIIDSLSGSAGKEGEIQSIHDRVAFKSEGLDKKLIFDRVERRSFMDHIFEFMPSAEQLRMQGVEEKGDFASGRYDSFSTVKGSTATVAMSREGYVRMDGRMAPIKISKDYRMDGKNASLSCEYSILNLGEGAVDFVFGVEWNFTLLAGDALDRFITVENEQYRMNSAGELKGVSAWSMTDGYFRFFLDFAASWPVTLARYPVETVSQSEGGFESNYQGTAFVALAPVSLEPGAKITQKYILSMRGID